MPANHKIDHDNKLIVTTWEGKPTIQDLSVAYKTYQEHIRTSDLSVYDELVDFTTINGFRLKSSGLRMLADSAARSDKGDAPTKLAVVVRSGLTFGLARMDEIYRNLSPMKSKEIKVFQNMYYALAWLEKKLLP